MKICRRAPGISHLLFADDTLLFFEAEQSQTMHVRSILNAYTAATGQLLNPAKCSILFGESCPIIRQHEVRAMLQVDTIKFEERYLGLPTIDGRVTKDKFQNLHVKLAKRMLLWGCPSQDGKEVLIKSIAQSIPTYIMSIFKLPLGLCDELNYTPSIPLCKVYYFRHGDQGIELSTS